MIKTIYIENAEQQEYIRSYYIDFHKKQMELENEDTLIYPAIPINIAVKHGILCSDFILHPTILKKRKFYEDIKVVSNRKDIAELISMVLQSELLKDSSNLKLSEDTLKVLIRAHKKLSRVNKKKDVVV